MLRDALISPCEKYRYVLTRLWSYNAKHNYPMSIVMLNPSTADAEIDDRTICRCISFAQREGYGSIHVSNLFAYRATKPEEMKSATDPVGPDNNGTLEVLLRQAKNCSVPVLCAWGAHGSYLDRDQWFINLARKMGTDLVHLGLTKMGHPKHPLYIKSDQPFGVLYR
jgi:hypothetical protein